MGANAQTSVPAFTAGQVLTAAQVTGINTGIPVFASSTERDAAFGGTGEKTLAEGQMAYLEDTNTTQYYDGSSWAAVAGGKILQIIQATYSTAESTSSDSYVDTSLDATITPSAATSKVLIICNVSWKTERTQVSSGYVYHAIERSGSQIWEQVSGQYYDAQSSVVVRNIIGNSTLTYLDSPATTSATTYTLQHRKGPSGQTVTATSFFDDIPGSLILMEVSA